MPFDSAPETERRLSGQVAYQNGLAAEDIVCVDYQRCGFVLVERRWRGRCGEIDLIFDGPEEMVFVEVKKARSHEAARARLSQRQLERVAQSAEDYIAIMTATPLRPIRIDLATVDGAGTVSRLENLTLY